MSSTISVIPKEYVKTNTIKCIKVSVISLELYKSVHINCLLLNDEEQVVDCKYFTLENNDYLNWMNDDDYITNYCISQLELVRN